jgi:hypothetical protein
VPLLLLLRLLLLRVLLLPLLLLDELGSSLELDSASLSSTTMGEDEARSSPPFAASPR